MAKLLYTLIQTYNTPQFLNSLSRRASARNVSFHGGNSTKFLFSPSHRRRTTDSLETRNPSLETSLVTGQKMRHSVGNKNKPKRKGEQERFYPQRVHSGKIKDLYAAIGISFWEALTANVLFSRLFKMSSDSASLIFCARLFQRRGATTEHHDRN